MKGADRIDRGLEEDALGDLFRHVPVRPQPPAADAAAVREGVHAEWMEVVRPRRLARQRVAWAAAASVALAMFAWFPWERGGRAGEGAALAEVERAIGASQVIDAEPAREHALEDRSALGAGDAIVTQSGSRVALRWRTGVQLRLDSNSRLELVSATALKLVYGRIYLDTGSAADVAVPEIQAPIGTFRHTGTQYQVRVHPGLTELLVREGRIELVIPDVSPDGRTVATAGQRLSVTADREVAIEPVPTWGEAWGWVEEAAPAFDADGRTLAELLHWVARETGRTVAYESPEVRQQAGEVVLHGAIGLRPADALEVAMATTDLVARVQESRIEVSAGE